MLCKKKKRKKKVVGLFLRSRRKIGTLTIRRSGMLRSYKFGSRRFDIFATGNFLRLARSCRVVEKFDKNIDFSWFSADRVPRSDRSDRISPQRDKISANGEKYFQQMYWTLCCRDCSVWVHRSAELCLCDCRILLKSSVFWLSGCFDAFSTRACLCLAQLRRVDEKCEVKEACPRACVLALPA